MRYVRAQDVLPENILKIIQNMSMENIFIFHDATISKNLGEKKVALKSI